MSTPNSQVFELPAVPPVLSSFARAAWSATRPVRGEVAIPAWSARVARLSFDRKHLADYNALCGFADLQAVPILYPQIVATPVFLHLMTRPGFPLPLMGLVHVRNRIEQRRALAADETLDLQVSLAGSRAVRAGLELDIVTELHDDAGDPLWKATMTVLRRGRSAKSAERAPAPAPVEIPAFAQYLSLDAPADIGRRYAAVSRDFNPIHLSAASARLFGFPRAIAHGLWSAARVLALLDGRLGAAPRAFDVSFRQPLLLPGKAALRYVQEGLKIDFALLDAHAGKTHLTGTLR